MTVGWKQDAGKTRWSLLPWRALAVVVEVLEHGASRYGADNWQHVENAERRYFDAAQRHLLAWWGGERTDEDSGLPHLAHAACCVLFLVAFDSGGGPRVSAQGANAGDGVVSPSAHAPAPPGGEAYATGPAAGPPREASSR